jgi:hypothetical protein
MATVSISIPDQLKDTAESRAREAGFDSLSDYLCALLMAEAGEPLDAETEAKLLEGLASPAREITRADWEEKMRQVERRLSAAQGRKP